MKRKITKDIIAHLPQKQLSLLIGQLGSGKTYVLKELGNLLSKNGFTNFFLDFDNISMSMYLNESPERIFRFIPHPDELEKKPFYLLLDNLQQLKQPYFLLDYLYDKFKSQIKVIAAGSSDFYLNSIGEDALPGKKKIFRIRGFDFDES
ncbi:MAG: AAA family ATPase [Bacteroidetes bacterium]|nr:AAA family ATPase [Bacteroidota bacterium]